MPLLERLQRLVGMESDRSFTYQCTECDLVFESPDPSRSKVSCPDCGSGRVQSTPNKRPTAEA